VPVPIGYKATAATLGFCECTQGDRQILLSQRAARLARLLVRSHENVTFQRRYAPQIKEKAENVAAIAEISLI
jgi:hypothetical protein